jgi:hypothetical protein
MPAVELDGALSHDDHYAELLRCNRALVFYLQSYLGSHARRGRGCGTKSVAQSSDCKQASADAKLAGLVVILSRCFGYKRRLQSPSTRPPNVFVFQWLVWREAVSSRPHQPILASCDFATTRVHQPRTPNWVTAEERLIKSMVETEDGKSRRSDQRNQALRAKSPAQMYPDYTLGDTPGTSLSLEERPSGDRVPGLFADQSFTR